MARFYELKTNRPLYITKGTRVTPLDQGAITVDGYDYDDVYGYTWGRNIIGNGRAAVDASFDRYFRAIGAAQPVGSPR